MKATLRIACAAIVLCACGGQVETTPGPDSPTWVRAFAGQATEAIATGPSGDAVILFREIETITRLLRHVRADGALTAVAEVPAPSAASTQPIAVRDQGDVLATAGDVGFLSAYTTSGARLWTLGEPDVAELVAVVQPTPSGAFAIGNATAPTEFSAVAVPVVDSQVSIFVLRVDARGRVSWGHSVPLRAGGATSGAAQPGGESCAVLGSASPNGDRVGSTSVASWFVSRFVESGPSWTFSPLIADARPLAGRVQFAGDTAVLVAIEFDAHIVLADGESLEPRGPSDILLASIDATTGALVWTTRIGGDGAERLEDMKSQSDGALTVISGTTNSQEVLVGDTARSGAGDASVGFIAALDRRGELVWLETTNESARVGATAFGRGGALFVAGDFGERLSLGPLEVSASGLNNGYVARLDLARPLR